MFQLLHCVAQLSLPIDDGSQFCCSPLDAFHRKVPFLPMSKATFPEEQLRETLPHSTGGGGGDMGFQSQCD